MTYSMRPTESKNQIRKAGETLVHANPDSNEFKEARLLADKWRACHAYPLNTFNVTLRKNVKKIPNNPIVAQRLKRMSTIIDKLRRYPNMQLTTMQDIGGIRGIVSSIENVYQLVDIYKKSKAKHDLYNEHDYISGPRDQDGYRSYHLMYRYNNPSSLSYNGLQIELQIRTKLQHLWATAVETMGTLLDQGLKSRQGSQDWLDFFAITSSAFAYIEKSPLIPKYQSLSRQETFKLVAESEKKIAALEKMSGLNHALRIIQSEVTFKRKPGWHYQLIVLDMKNHEVRITPYTKAQFEKANADYAKIEENSEKEMLEPVLVAAGQFKDIKQAYPNFFLDINEFAAQLERIIQLSKLQKVDAKDLTRGPIRHKKLSPDLVKRITSIHETFSEVLSVSLEESINNYKRDVHPEAEVLIWEHIQRAYLVVNEQSSFDLAKKKEVLGVILRLSMGPWDDDDENGFNLLNKKEFELITKSWIESALK